MVLNYILVGFPWLISVSPKLLRAVSLNEAVPFASRNSIINYGWHRGYGTFLSLHIQNSKLRFKTFPAYIWIIKVNVAARLRLTWEMALGLEIKASFRDSYRFLWRSVRFWRCTQREKVGRSKAIRSRADHRLGACSPREFLNLSTSLGARECHFLRYPQDILLSTKENANG